MANPNPNPNTRTPEPEHPNTRTRTPEPEPRPEPEPEPGGETHFPHLELKVSPRAGDAVAWANVDAEGAPNPLSLHEGLPPAPGEEKVVINVWIADRAFSPDELSKAYRTG